MFAKLWELRKNRIVQVILSAIGLGIAAYATNAVMPPAPPSPQPTPLVVPTEREQEMYIHRMPGCISIHFSEKP